MRRYCLYIRGRSPRRCCLGRSTITRRTPWIIGFASEWRGHVNLTVDVILSLGILLGFLLTYLSANDRTRKFRVTIGLTALVSVGGVWAQDYYAARKEAESRPKVLLVKSDRSFDVDSNCVISLEYRAANEQGASNVSIEAYFSDSISYTSGVLSRSSPAITQEQRLTPTVHANGQGISCSLAYMNPSDVLHLTVISVVPVILVKEQHLPN